MMSWAIGSFVAFKVNKMMCQQSLHLEELDEMSVVCGKPNTDFDSLWSEEERKRYWN